MSRKAQSPHWDSLEHEKARRDKVSAKIEKIQTLKALLETWEAKASSLDADYDYILELRAKLRSAVNQYKSFSL